MVSSATTATIAHQTHVTTNAAGTPAPGRGAAVAHRGFDGAGSAPVCDHEPERDNCGRTEGDCGDGILPENNGSADQREDGHERQQRPAPGQPGAFDL